MSLYPLVVLYNELNWKLSVVFDSEQDCFALYVNDYPLLELP